MEILIMKIVCPYCHSENIQRVLHKHTQQASSSNTLGSSATFATIGATLTKSLAGQLPISPWMGGVAGALVGGLVSSIFEPPRTTETMPTSYFYCPECDQPFH